MRIRLMALVCLCLCSFFVSGCVESKKAQEVKKLKVTHLNVTTGLPEQIKYGPDLKQVCMHMMG